MEELLKEIRESLKVRKQGIEYRCYDYKTKTYIEGRHIPYKGIGTKAYTIRRINMLEDKLKELKTELNNGKYDFS